MLTRLFGVPVMVMLLALSGCTRSDAASPLPEVPSDIKKQLAFASTPAHLAEAEQSLVLMVA